MDKLECSLCGWKSGQKRFKYKEINKHFENAVQVWCPRKICQEQYGRNIPAGCECNYWSEYSGWCTVEKKPKIIPIEHVQGVMRARRILEAGLKMMEQEENK